MKRINPFYIKISLAAQLALMLATSLPVQAEVGLTHLGRFKDCKDDVNWTNTFSEKSDPTTILIPREDFLILSDCLKDNVIDQIDNTHTLELENKYDLNKTITSFAPKAVEQRYLDFSESYFTGHNLLVLEVLHPYREDHEVGADTIKYIKETKAFIASYAIAGQTFALFTKDRLYKPTPSLEANKNCDFPSEYVGVDKAMLSKTALEESYKECKGEIEFSEKNLNIHICKDEYCSD